MRTLRAEKEHSGYEIKVNFRINHCKSWMLDDKRSVLILKYAERKLVFVPN